MTKTKFALCAIASTIVASFGLSMCSEKDTAPMSAEQLKTARMYQCSGFNEYLAQNTPNMPVDIQSMHQSMAVEFYKVAQKMPHGVDIGDNMDSGRTRAKDYLQKGNRKAVVDEIQMCKAQIQQYFADEAAKGPSPEEIAENLAKEEQERKAQQKANELLKQKQQREEYAQELYQCSGIFIYNGTNIPGISKQNRDTQTLLGMNTYKLAEMMGTQVDAKIWGMKGADKAHNYVRNGNLQGMKSEMEECQRKIQYVMQNKTTIGY